MERLTKTCPLLLAQSVRGETYINSECREDACAVWVELRTSDDRIYGECGLRNTLRR